MSATSPTDSDDTTLSPQDALRLLESEERAHGARLAAPVPAILLSWGVAWIGIYLLLWSAGGLLSLPAALAAAGGLLVAAVVVSAVLGARTGRGIRATPGAVFTGTVYGISWTLGITLARGE